MTTVSENNKRIAKNTIYLYVRLLFSMAVSLYTSRVVLATLGANDFGLNSVVTSVITIFFFLNSSMAGATSRFLTFELGKNDLEKFKKVFSAALTIHIIIALIILILGETIGLWYLENKMVIPEGRMTAAHWVYQLSLVSAMITLTQVPYNASIIAHERMNVYAYIEILGTCLKLGIVYLLVIGNLDKLILYAILTLCVTIIMTLIYRAYCMKHFTECRYKFEWDRKILYPMLSFSGWDLYGIMGSSLKTNGINIVLNLFFTTVINAAFSVSMQVCNTVDRFSSNFLISVNPQIIKYYADGKIKEMENLVVNASRFSILLNFLFFFPLILEIDFILNLWLKEVPLYTNIFCQLFFIMIIINTLWKPLTSVIQATAKIKIISIVTGSLYLLIPVISYVIFKLGNRTVYVPLLVALVIYVIVFIVNLRIVHHLVPEFSIFLLIKKAILENLIIIIASGILPVIVRFSLDSEWLRIILIIILTFTIMALTTYYFALSKSMKEKIKHRLLIIKK